MVVFLVAFVLAAVLSLIFGLALGWRRPGGGGTAWSGVLFFFSIVWLTTWALSAWTQPGGTEFVTAPLLTVLFIAVVVSLLIAAVTPSPSRWAGRSASARGTGVPEETERIEVGVGVFFWILILLLLASLIARYIWWGAGAVP